MSTRGALPSKAKTKAYWRSCFILFLCLLPWRKVETSEECEASVGGNLGQVAAERRPVKEGTTPGTPISLSFDWCINRKSASTLTNICLFALSFGLPLAFPGGVSGKELVCQFRRHKRCGSIPGSGRSPGEEKGNPLQYSCLENPRGQRSLVDYSP